jgi:hypothetical protein
VAVARHGTVARGGGYLYIYIYINIYLNGQFRRGSTLISCN